MVNMSRNDFSARKISSAPQWLRVYGLYRRAFPRDERKPFHMILSMWHGGKTDVWYFEQDGRFAGFASTINGAELILLDYLAVPERLRDRGVGSRALQALKQGYRGKGLFVEIEDPHEAAPNRHERVRRKRFYLNNGFVPARVMAEVFGVRMELLCWNCRVDFPEYRAFYRAHYSAWAAQHIIEAEYPGKP